MVIIKVRFVRILGRALLLWLGVHFATLVANGQASGMDSGVRAQTIVGWDQRLLNDWSQGRPWLRIRELPNPSDLNVSALVKPEAEALRRLDHYGFRPIPFLRWSSGTWKTGVRPGGGKRVPLDLREAYRRAHAYSQAYGDVVAGFEIENEPDISFVQENPETYMAFLKAAYLGIKQGAIDAKAVSDKPKAPSGSETELRADRLGHKAATPSLIYRKQLGRRGGAWETLSPQELIAYRLKLKATERAGSPLVVMAPLALPPGPYFEQLLANGLFSYTDAFNYHYYGYAEDFSGVYRQFESAVADTGRGRRIPPGFQKAGFDAPALQKKTWPVLLTEYGYGSLSGDDRDTVEGRVRQWQWFRSVGDQILKLRIAGPMAFYLSPYLENRSIEFGLTHRRPDGVGCGDSVLQFTAGGLAYTPADFGLKKPMPWMARIGQGFGENESTPALAWLVEEGARKSYRPKDWTVQALEPSPVVIDFIAGEGLVQQKRYGGYVAILDGDEHSTSNSQHPTLNARALSIKLVSIKSGVGQFTLYNLSDELVRGRLEIVHGRGLLADSSSLEREWTLAPRARVLVPVSLMVPAHEFTRHELALRFTADSGRSLTHSPHEPQRGPSVSIFSSFFYPEASGMKEILVHDFSSAFSAQPLTVAQRRAIHHNRILLEHRRLATEEPKLASVGHWNVTQGVRVEELTNQTWRFHIEGFPAEPNKPAMAELILPDDFEFPDGGMMQFSYRLVRPEGATLANGKYFEAYFRTANGNLYQVWPRQYAIAEWHAYTETKENYTMAFYGRANMPWRFRENRPTALVFFFRPGPRTLPAIYEVKNARIVRLRAEAGK